MQELLSRIEKLKDLLAIGPKKVRISQIEEEMNSVDFWLDENNSSSATRELKNLKTQVASFDELDDLAELAESDDDINLVEGKVAELEKLALFSGRYDNHGVVLSFYAGAGGDDAQDWTEM